MGSNAEYSDRLVCFIDILGFRNMVDKTVGDDGADQNELITEIKDIFKVGQYFIKPDEDDELNADVRVTWFSDSIVLSFDYTSESQIFHRLLSLQWMLINFAYRGVLCRGGIAQGKIVHTEEMIFGPAMNEAYDLENNAAIFPRIIVSDDIVNLAGMYRKHGHAPDEEVSYVKDLLELDGDGFYYINYVGLSAQQELDDPEYDFPIYLDCIFKILTKIKNSKSIRIKMKYEWLKRKYNDVVKLIHESVEQGKYQPADSDLLLAYSSIPIEE
jgi:hypothetical protein